MTTLQSGSSQMQAHTLISEVLEGKCPALAADLLLGDISGWDSVIMVRLVVSLENRLGRQLTDSELEAIETVGDVETLMRSKPAS